MVTHMAEYAQHVIAARAAKLNPRSDPGFPAPIAPHPPILAGLTGRLRRSRFHDAGSRLDLQAVADLLTPSTYSARGEWPQAVTVRGLTVNHLTPIWARGPLPLVRVRARALVPGRVPDKNALVRARLNSPALPVHVERTKSLMARISCQRPKAIAARQQ